MTTIHQIITRITITITNYGFWLYLTRTQDGFLWNPVGGAALPLNSKII